MEVGTLYNRQFYNTNVYIVQLWITHVKKSNIFDIFCGNNYSIRRICQFSANNLQYVFGAKIRTFHLLEIILHWKCSVIISQLYFYDAEMSCDFLTVQIDFFVLQCTRQRKTGSQSLIKPVTNCVFCTWLCVQNIHKVVEKKKLTILLSP